MKDNVLHMAHLRMAMKVVYCPYKPEVVSGAHSSGILDFMITKTYVPVVFHHYVCVRVYWTY